MTQDQHESPHPSDSRARHEALQRMIQAEDLAARQQLQRIDEYLERQTDLAFLAYRRHTTSTAPCDLLVDRMLTSQLYARWIAQGDAMFLFRTIQSREVVDPLYRKHE